MNIIVRYKGYRRLSTVTTVGGIRLSNSIIWRIGRDTIFIYTIVANLSDTMVPFFHAHVIRIEYLLIVRIPFRYTLHGVGACAVGLFGCDNPLLGHSVK